MGLSVKSVNVKTLKYHVYQGEKEIGSVYSINEESAKKLAELNKVEYVNEKPPKETKEKGA